jgi:hypothetical protein
LETTAQRDHSPTILRQSLWNPVAAALSIAKPPTGDDSMVDTETTQPSESTPEPNALPPAADDHVALTGNASIRSMAAGGVTHTSDTPLQYASLAGLNIIGMKRRKFSHDRLAVVAAFYQKLFHRSGLFAERLHGVRHLAGADPAIAEIVAFIDAERHRALCLPAKNGRAQIEIHEAR